MWLNKRVYRLTKTFRNNYHNVMTYEITYNHFIDWLVNNNENRFNVVQTLLKSGQKSTLSADITYMGIHIVFHNPNIRSMVFWEGKERSLVLYIRSQVTRFLDLELFIFTGFVWFCHFVIILSAECTMISLR